MSQRLIVSHHPSFQEQALNEIGRLCRFQATDLAPGVTLVQLEGAYQPLRQKWRRRPPIYLHHLMPVQRRAERLSQLEPWLAARLRPSLGFQLHFHNGQELTAWLVRK